MNIDIDQSIEDPGELSTTNIKINPDYYIHNAIVKGQNALATDDPQIGFLKFRIFIEQVESLARAAKIIKENDSYHTEIKKFISESKEESKSIKEAQIANKKLELLMKEIFESGTIFDSISA